MKDLLTLAQTASNPPDLVRINRSRLAAGPLEGFVLAVSPDLVLLNVLSDRIDLDGYAVLRMADVTGIDREFRRKSFFLRALQLKDQRPTMPQGVELTDIPSLLRSVQDRFSLVVIHREMAAPDECEIGRIKLASESTYALRWISPDGTWEDDNKSYKYSDVTRVGFGGEYEETLALVATGRNPSGSQ